jgi:hypothetical protein
MYTMTNYETEYYTQEIKKQEKLITKAENLIQTHKQKLCLAKQKLDSRHLPINKLLELPNDILIIIWKKTICDFLYMQDFNTINNLIGTIGFKKCNINEMFIENKEYQSYCLEKIQVKYYQKAYHLFSTKTKKEYAKHCIYFNNYNDYFILFGNDELIKNRYKFLKRISEKNNIRNRCIKICYIIDCKIN